MTNNPEGNDNTTPDDEISEEILDNVNGGMNAFSVDLGNGGNNVGISSN